MDHFNYLIIGGGMTADAAVKGIREIDKQGSICVISAETNPPYSRPPLTKGLWKGSAEEKIWRKTSDHKAEIKLNTLVTEILPGFNKIVTDRKAEYGYDKLLIATGGKVIRLPFGGDDMIYYRTFEDYKKLRKHASDKQNYVIVGGGFIGSEIAAALAMNGKSVSMIFPGKGIGDRIFPAELSEYVTEYYRSKNVEVYSGDSVTGIDSKDGTKVINTQGGRELNADVVIGGIGIRPDTSLAEAAGLTIDNGIVVDEELRTSVHNIFAAGDVANFYNPSLDKRIRVEHEDNALSMGKHAGRIMAGAEQPYFHLPFFYSDLFELGYEAVGELDPAMEVIEDWHEKFKKGVIYYLSEGRVRGVLLWNVWNRVDDARILISEEGPYKPGDLRGRIH
jgi:NADPH-dependent 2,4-dienoyl-CoA reductase/sulfur reductase-like enzyme